MPRKQAEKTRHTFPRQWLADPKAREMLSMFNKSLPKRPWVSVTDDDLDEWLETYSDIQRAYFKRHPSYAVEIGLYGDKQQQSKGQKFKGFPLLEMNSLGLNYWDTDIPLGTEIYVDSPPFVKLAKVLLENGKETVLETPSWCTYCDSKLNFVVVKLIERIPRPVGALIDEKVRDATQATPSHSHLMTYWSEHGFLPKDQPLALQGDCLPRAVMLALKPSFDKLFKKTKLTIELITSLCGTTPEMSVPELLPFLEKYRISLFVYDLNDKVMYQKDYGELRNKKMVSRINLLLHNKHTTLLNHELQSFVRQPETSTTGPSKHFFAGKVDVSAVTMTTYAEIKEAIKSTTNYTRIYYLHQEDETTEHEKGSHRTALTKVFKKICTELNLEPLVAITTSNQAKELHFKHPALSIILTTVSMTSLKTVTDSVFVQHLKSFYSPNFQRIIRDLKRGPVVRHWEYQPQAPKVDYVRSYTSIAHTLEKVPQFNQEDVFVAYDESLLEPYTLYIVQALTDSPEHYIILNREYNLVSGLVLTACGFHPKIVAMCRPSNIVTNPLCKLIKDLYKDPNNPDLKSIINITLGMAAKTENKKRWGHFSTNPAEAQYFADDPMNPPIPFAHGYLGVKESTSVELVDGFYPLTFMVYDIQRLRMLELYRKLIPHTRVLGISTDAFYVETLPPWTFHDGLKTLESLGTYRYEGIGLVPKSLATIVPTPCPLICSPLPYTKVQSPTSGTFIEGIIPGTGKTYSAVEFMGCLLSQPVLSTKSLIVKQSNAGKVLEQSRTHNCDVVTYAQLKGERVDDNKKVTKGKPLDLSTYTHILLDELIQSTDNISVIPLLEGRGLSILATGDPDQNIFNTRINKDARELWESNLWRILPNRLTLTDWTSTWRMSAGDVAIMKQMKADFQSQGVIPTLQALVSKGILKATTDLSKFDTHIGFTNECCSLLEDTYTKPITLRYDGYDKDKILIHGMEYPVVYRMVKGKHMVKIGEKFYPHQHFLGTHAKTGFIMQGDTINKPFCILEWDHSHADWQWVLTAIARCKRLSDVHLYTGPSLSTEYVRNVKEKLRSYKATDLTKGHEFDLTPKWVRDTLKKQRYCCGHCGGRLTLNYKKGDTNQWSVDRKDNAQGHLQSNCWILHETCNKSLAP